MKKETKFRKFLTRVGEVRIAQIWDKFRKPFNVCWKVGTAMIAIILVITLIEEAVSWAQWEFGLKHLYWADEDLGRNIEVRRFSDELYATYDKLTDKRISPKMRWISGVPERDSLTVFCDKEGRRGYINVNTGEVVIDGQYKHAWHFSEGLAAVVAENGKVGFINYENEMVIPAGYDYVVDYDYLFIGGICIVPDGQTDKYGAIDRQGVLKLPMEYSSFFKSNDESTWYLRKDMKCGLADADMNIIFEPIYDNVESQPWDNNAYLTLNGVKQLVSFDGEVISPFVIDEIWPMKYMVKYNVDTEDEYEIHPYLVEVMVDVFCHGVMDSRTGKMVIPAIYSDIQMVSKDLIMAEVDGDEENNILFNTKGVIVD